MTYTVSGGALNSTQTKPNCARRGAARLLLHGRRAAIDRYLLFAGPTAANPQQRSSAGEWDIRTDTAL